MNDSNKTNILKYFQLLKVGAADNISSFFLMMPWYPLLHENSIGLFMGRMFGTYFRIQSFTFKMKILCSLCNILINSVEWTKVQPWSSWYIYIIASLKPYKHASWLLLFYSCMCNLHGCKLLEPTKLVFSLLF